MTQPLTERRMALTGAVLVAIGPLSMALYTPAMPLLAEALGTDAAAIKLSLTIYLVGFAVAQLICGPLSDRYGRRPVILGFTVLYLIGSAAALAATGPGTLIAGRLVQGIGACAGVAVSRAMVRDLFTGQAAARIMSTIGMILSVAPAAAPILGGLLIQVASWRWLFALMAAYGAGLILLAIWGMPETNTRPSVGAARPSRLVGNYGLLLSDRRYMRPTLVCGMAVGGIYTFSAIVPFVLINRVGLSPTTYGAVMASIPGAYFFGAILANGLMRRIEARHLVGIGMAAVLASGLALGACLWFLGASVATVILPILAWMVGIALLTPGATMEALTPFPTMAGAAAALLGFMQMGAGAAGSALGALFPNSVVSLAVMPAAMGALGMLALLGLRSPPEDGRAGS